MLRIKRPNLLHNKTLVSSMVLVLGFAGTAGALQLLPSDSNQTQVTSSRPDEPVERASVDREEKSKKSESQQKTATDQSADWTQQPRQAQNSQSSNTQTTASSSSTTTAQSSSQPSSNQSTKQPSSTGNGGTTSPEEPGQNPDNCVEDGLIDCVTGILR